MSDETPRVWPELERGDVLAALRVDAAKNARRGVILCGDAGVGKTTVAHQLARGRGREVITIRGGDVMSEVPYGALYGMLTEASLGAADARSLDQPGQVAAALAEVVESRSTGGAPTVILDNAGLLDEATAFLLGQLIDRIHLIVVAGSLGDVPDPLLELWRDGILGMREIEALSSTEVAELLTRHLGSPIALSAADALHHASGGNPLFLHHLVTEQIDALTLVQHDGVWVLERAAALQDQRLVDVLRVRLDRWSEGQRLVLEIVALTDSIPFTLLEQLVEGEDIASLLDDTVIVMGRETIPTVRVRHRHIAELVRFGVSFPRRRQLREQVVAADSAGTLTATTEGVLAFASWTLACGAPLDPAIAVRAAEAANTFFDPEFALRLAASVQGGPLASAAAVEKSRAWRLLGLPSTAVNILTAASTGENAPIGAEELVDLAAEWVASAHQVAGQGDAAGRMLGVARDAVDAQPGVSDDLSDRLDIARWDLFAGSGRYVDLVTELEGVTADQASGGAGADADGRRVAARSVLAAAYALVGRQTDALELLALDPRAAQVAGGAGGGELPNAVLDLEYAARFDVLLRCGSFDECLATLARERDERAHQMLFYGSAADSSAATVLLFAGRAREALPLLHSALAQLRVRDVRSTAGQVFAGLAYASALLGDQSASQAYLADYGEGIHTHWHTMASATYLALGAQALVGDREAAIAAMVEGADARAAEGLAMEELVLLAAAARYGSTKALARIPERAMTQPGVAATRINDWATARIAADPAALTACAESLLAQDDVLFALDAAEHAVALDPESRRATALVGAAQERMGIEPTSISNVLDMLTKRERDVVERASRGDANKDIADELFLSVRTVESYLQSAYGKLGVAGRAGLTELLA